MTFVAPQPLPITKAQADEAVHRLTRCRTSLILSHPFIGSLALRLQIAAGRVKTACVDGETMTFDPAFMATLRDSELKYVMAHEVLHCALDHLWRRGGRAAKRFNVAADIVVNQALDDDNVGMAPACAVRDPALFNEGNGVVESIYDLLPDDASDEDGIGQDMKDPQDTNQQEGEGVSGQREAWKVHTLQAAQMAAAQGTLPAGMRRLVKDMLEPRVDWRDVLRMFLHRSKADDRTFARPSRRWLSQGLYLPSRGGEALGHIVVAVDCSGSITDRVLAQFSAEIRAIHEDMRPAGLTVVYFDSDVSHTDTFGPDDTVSVEHHGGGGTAFSPIWKHVEDMNIDPVACVVLTDLECSDFGHAPSYPVLWVSIERASAPFGEVVVIK